MYHRNAEGFDALYCDACLTGTGATTWARIQVDYWRQLRLTVFRPHHFSSPAAIAGLYETEGLVIGWVDYVAIERPKSERP